MVTSDRVHLVQWLLPILLSVAINKAKPIQEGGSAYVIMYQQ